jgi:O-antigen/teichoic acid export membrane protein
MGEDLFEREREPPPLPLVARVDAAAPPSLPLVDRARSADPVAAPVVAKPPRLAPAVRPELVRVAVAVGLTLYLVRALSPAHYGVFVLAGSIAGLAGFPVVDALGLGVARLLSDHGSSPDRVRQATALALRIALPIAVVVGLAVAVAAGTIARAYGFPALAWPLRWAGLAIIAGCALRALQMAAAGLRGGRVAGVLVVGEAVLELVATVGFVVAGAGVSGAAAARPLAYAAAAALGAALVFATGRRRGATVRAERDPDLSVGALVRSAGGASAVGLVWTAVVPVQAILIGAISGAPAVGSLGAEVRLLTPIASISVVAALVYVRRAVGGAPDSEARRTLKWSIVASGLLVAPCIVWASPISAGLLGSGHPGSAAILRWLAVYAFLAAPTAVLSVIDSRVGGAGRWALVAVVLGYAELVGYAAIRAFGVAGAAVTIDGFVLATLLLLLLASSTRSVFDRRAALLTAARTVLAAAAMAAVLLAAGTERLSTVGWLAGAVGGVAAFAAVLLVAGEISLTRIGRRRATSPV